MLSLFKKIFLHKHNTEEVDKLFNFMAMLTRQEDAVENYLFRYDKLRRKMRKHGDSVFIDLYLDWEEFVVNDSIATGKKTTKESIRRQVADQIDIEKLSNHFKLVFMEERVQLSYLYSLLLTELADYVGENLGKRTLDKIIREAGERTIFKKIDLREGKINLDAIHNQIRIHPAEYPPQSITKMYKAFITSFYNKIELSLGENIVQGIFRKLYENFKDTYNADFATLLLNITPEKVLGLDEWLSLLSKSELEKQVKEKTEELRILNESLESRVQKRTEELKKAYEDLKELDKKKTEFISIAAHQIRTPVSGIKWILDMMIKEEAGELSGEQKTFLEKARRANEQLLVIVNNLLDTDLITTGQTVYQLKQVDLYDIIKNEIANFAPQANSREVDVIWNREPESDGMIEADEKRIQSVIENLLDNAIKYSNKDDIVTIDTKKEGGDMIITVKDTGIGVPKDSMDDIFKRFYRAPNAIRLHANGSGLGLFITQNIVKKHHGDIEFTSTEGKGSTFIVKIPVKQPEEL